MLREKEEGACQPPGSRAEPATPVTSSPPPNPHQGPQLVLAFIRFSPHISCPSIPEPPCDPAILLVDIYPEKNMVQKDTCTPMFTAALFTIAKIWKQPKCPSTEEWIKKMWCIYTMEYYSAIKKNEIMPFAATWMDLEIIILSKVSQKEKDKYHMISLIYRI